MIVKFIVITYSYEYTILLVVLFFQLKYESLNSLRIRLSRNLKMTRPNLCGRYSAVCSEDAVLRREAGRAQTVFS